MTWSDLGRAALVAALVVGTGAALAQQESAPPQGFSTVVEVIARSVAIDVVDARGVPVTELPPGVVRVFEDGVERTVLALARRARPAASAAPDAGGATQQATAAPTVVASHVLVALDPTTLGPREWREATGRLAEAADALVALGPVDVVALTAPPRTFAAAVRDAGAVRSALAAATTEVAPSDGFYQPRLRFARDVQAAMGGGPSAFLRPPGAALPAGSDEPLPGGHDPAAHRQALIGWLRSQTQQLAAEEERTLRVALDRLREALGAVRRPTVAVWVAGGEPLSAEFVRSLLPPGEATEVDQQVLWLAQWTAFWSELDGVWRSWAEAGVRVVAWGPARVDEVDLGTADARVPITTRYERPRRKLSSDPLVLLAAAATATGGALVQDPAHLADLLDSVAGRFVVTYQTDRAAAGWHELRLEVDHEGWRARYPLRVLAPEPSPRPAELEPVAAVLAVQFAAERYPSDQPGRDLVKLRIVVVLDALREVLPPGSPATFAVRVFATPPGAETVVRDVDLKLAALPPAGNLLYEPSLVVPRGTSAFAVEVREKGSGAMGVAGPLDAVGEDPGAGAAATDPPAADAAAPAGAFSESAEVRISEARFLVPKDTDGAPEGVRVVWEGTDQKLLRVAGGAGSSLELGIAFDVSESAADERAAFARAAVAAAGRLLGDGDRLFRVDFGSTPRFLGATRSGAGGLLAALPTGVPEKTAIFDALRYSLERFAGQSDRSALVVFTDGCETAGTTPWSEVTRAARAKAIPIFVVLADAEGCAGLPDLELPSATSIASVTSTRAAPGQTMGRTRVVQEAGPRRADALRAGERAESSRNHLRDVAYESGGLVVAMRRAERAEKVWEEVEAALGRLWVAVFEPSSRELDSRKVEVRSSAGRLLRPSA